jgi:hypothetical protein
MDQTPSRALQLSGRGRGHLRGLAAGVESFLKSWKSCRGRPRGARSHYYCREHVGWTSTWLDYHSRRTFLLISYIKSHFFIKLNLVYC